MPCQNSEAYAGISSVTLIPAAAGDASLSSVLDPAVFAGTPEARYAGAVVRTRPVLLQWLARMESDGESEDVCFSYYRHNPT